MTIRMEGMGADCPTCKRVTEFVVDGEEWPEGVDIADTGEMAFFVAFPIRCTVCGFRATTEYHPLFDDVEVMSE